MPIDNFVSIVNQVKRLGAKTISIFGYGEPLMDHEIEIKIRYCTLIGLDTFITTNASLLDPDNAKRILDAGMKHIRFSVHSIWSDNYERLHKGLKYLDVLRNIFNFIVINRERYNGECKISVTTIPDRHSDIKDIRRFWEPHCDWLEVWRPHNWANNKEYRARTLTRKKTCGRPQSGPLQINADGKVMVCCFDTDATLTVGDTKQNTIEEIMKGAAFNEIRRKHEGEDLEGLICESCDQLNVLHESPLIYSNRDPLCQVGRTSTDKYDLNKET